MEIQAQRGDEGEALDLDHLARATFGDRGLEREVLALYLRQQEVLLACGSAPAVRQSWSAAAHKLMGSARSIGAFGLARLLEEGGVAPGSADLEREAERVRRAVEKRLATL